MSTYKYANLMSVDFKLKEYQNLFLQIKRGNSKGKPSSAKPILLISLIDSIKDSLFVNNRILYNDTLKRMYEFNYKIFASEEILSDFCNPFYHLESDGFWHIKWKISPKPDKTSDYKLRSYVDYAYLDNALWDLLQDEQNRNALRQSIINFYFKK